MIMKHYALNRCEQSIEVNIKMGVQWGGGGGGVGFFWGDVRVDVNVNEGFKLLCKLKKQSGEGGQVRVDVNEE